MIAALDRHIRIQVRTRPVSLPSSSSSRLSLYYVRWCASSLCLCRACSLCLSCAGAAAMCACACYRARNRHSRVIGMPAGPRQLSGQRRFEANLTSSTEFLPPYDGAPHPKAHTETVPYSWTYPTDLERGLGSSSHNRVPNDEVRPSAHDPLLRDQGLSRSPSPASIPEPTRPARTYQGYEPPPVCNQTYARENAAISDSCSSEYSRRTLRKADERVSGTASFDI